MDATYIKCLHRIYTVLSLPMVLNSLTLVGRVSTNGPFAQCSKLGKKSLLESFFTAAAHAQVHNFERDYMKVSSMFYLAESFSRFVYLV